MTAALLQVQDLVAGYQPGLAILQGVSLLVQEREIVTIIGPNGAGKSTLIKAIAGLVPISNGSVWFQGRDISQQATHELVGSGIAYVPQTANIFTTLTIHQNLCLAGHTLGAEQRQRIEQSYELFPLLAEKRRRKGRVLSGGQRQVLALAMALMSQPRLIMLDEPTAGLAPKVVAEVFDQLSQLVNHGVAVLLVEQNAQAALAQSHRGYVLAEGRNQHSGEAAALLDDPVVAAIYLGATRDVSQ